MVSLLVIVFLKISGKIFFFSGNNPVPIMKKGFLKFDGA